MNRRVLAAVAGMVLLALCAGFAAAAPEKGNKENKEIRLEVGKSRVVRYHTRLKRVSVGNPKVLEVMVVSPREMMMNAKAAGATSVVVWNVSGSVSTYDVTVVAVGAVAQRVRAGLSASLPKEKEIRVDQVGDGLVVSGVVSSERSREVALQIAETVAPKKVVDNLQVEEVPQVQIRVHFTEISRQGAMQLGWGLVRRSHGKHDLGLFPGSPGFAPQGTFLEPQTTDIGPDVPFSSVINLFLSNSARTSAFFLRALQEKGYLRTLAEPNLRVMSGKEAKFLVGGQVPVPVPGQNGEVTIMYRDFGIQLKFKPKVRKSGMIEFSVEPEVSQIDNTLAVAIQGFNVPGFKTSNTKTEVVLRDGQSMAISGLLSEQRRKNIGQLPFIGDVPILGELFKSRDFQKDKTELVVIVTPKIIPTRRMEEARLSRKGFEMGRFPGAAPASASQGANR